MATYRSYRELNGKTLTLNDVVIIFDYRIHADEKKFISIDISGKDFFEKILIVNMEESCKEILGYKPKIKDDFFPLLDKDDCYPDLTKLALFFFKRIENPPSLKLRIIFWIEKTFKVQYGED